MGGTAGPRRLGRRAAPRQRKSLVPCPAFVVFLQLPIQSGFPDAENPRRGQFVATGLLQGANNRPLFSTSEVRIRPDPLDESVCRTGYWLADPRDSESALMTERPNARQHSRIPAHCLASRRQ